MPSRKSRKSGKSRRLKRTARRSTRRSTRRFTRRFGVRTTKQKRGGGPLGYAPVSAPATILSPDEQASIFLYPSYDDMRYNNDFLDSRTPLLNTAVKWF